MKDAKAGKYNYLVFSLSIHGTQVPDVSGDEPDNADEAFCPYDLAQTGDEWDPKHIITDDELHDLLIQLPQKVLLEVFSRHLPQRHRNQGHRLASRPQAEVLAAAVPEGLRKAGRSPIPGTPCRSIGT